MLQISVLAYILRTLYKVPMRIVRSTTPRYPKTPGQVKQGVSCADFYEFFALNEFQTLDCTGELTQNSAHRYDCAESFGRCPRVASLKNLTERQSMHH